MLREANLTMLASVINCDLGYFIDNPNVTNSGNAFRQWLPWPFYMLSGRWQRDAYGARIYLADGGHSENHHDFPQRTTADQSYTPDQVIAYRELGYFIVTNNAFRIKALCDNPK
jgi:hypothetical protein